MRRVAVFVVLMGFTIGKQLRSQAAPTTPQVPATAQQTQINPTIAPLVLPPPTAQAAPARPDSRGKGSNRVIATTPSIKEGQPIEAGTIHAQRKAAKLYLDGVKLLEKQQPQPAWQLLKRAVEFAPDNMTYVKAAELARQSAVTQLVQESSRERTRAADTTDLEQGKDSRIEATKLLQQAESIDPTNPMVVEHLNEIADETSGITVGEHSSMVVIPQAVKQADAEKLAEDTIKLEPRIEKHSFHLHSSERQVLQEVFRAYGIEPSIHDSVENKSIKLDVDEATFPVAMRILSWLTNTFYEPLDPHRVVVARDTRENKNQFQHQEMETIYLPGLDDKELKEVSDVARQIFETTQAVTEPSSKSLTLRATPETMTAFNKTMAALEDGKSELDLDVKVIQLAHTSARETGTTFFQQTGIYNLASEASSIINQNQAAVQQIIAAGLVPNANGIANEIKIILILLAAGQLTGPPFNQGLIPFGNGLTSSVASISPASLTMSLNSSDTRVLDDIHLQLIDQEEGTFKIGERYPIETSSYSSVSIPAIAGLSSALTSAASQTVPQIQYEDIGLTFKARPKIMRSNDVALTVDLKISALGGTALNNIPILNNQQVSGVLTLKAGETAVLLSDLSRTESRALTGLPGVSDIPGLQDISDIERNQNVARLLILITPSVTRNVQKSGHGPMLSVDQPSGGHPGVP